MSEKQMHTETGATGEIENEESKNSTKVSNEYVLNVAFVSFFGFALFQIGFAIMADSQAMLADSEAMNIDAVTYLFNMCAERIKNRPISDYERELLVSERNYRRQMQRLCLELFPPLVSVFCLICITVATVREASQSLWGEKLDGDVDDDVSLPIMLIFSAMNLLLDVVNVTCFARADMNFGLDIVRNEAMDLRQSVTRRLSGEAKETVTETSSLLAMGVTDVESGVHNFREKTNLVNLNMCSAWTHVCADTLRSTAVLIAAGIAYLFPVIPPQSADSVAAIVVSVIIFVSLLPLVQGLCLTAIEIYHLTRNPPNSSLTARN